MWGEDPEVHPKPAPPDTGRPLHVPTFNLAIVWFYVSQGEQCNQESLQGSLDFLEDCVQHRQIKSFNRNFPHLLNQLYSKQP